MLPSFGANTLVIRALSDALSPRRSCRPRSRAVQRLAVAELLSEASKPDTTDGCATGRRTKPRHARGANSASWSFAPGRPLLLAVRWPEATGLTSYLSGCLALTSQRCGLSHRRRSGSFHRTSACVRILPVANPHFVRAFRRLWSGGAFFSPPEWLTSCWHTVATVHPLGDCDSPGLETSPGYLTWVGAVSHRSSPRSSFFAVPTARECHRRNR
jgi:hypothetical protein